MIIVDRGERKKRKEKRENYLHMWICLIVGLWVPKAPRHPTLMSRLSICQPESSIAE